MESCGNSTTGDCPCASGTTCNPTPYPGVCVPNGPPPTTCPDGACNGGETCSSCAQDCGSCPPFVIGDGTRTPVYESCGNSPSDCPCWDPANPVCNTNQGNGVCVPTPPSCGDGQCNGNESCSTCSADCGACGPVCGDGNCVSGESCSSCSADCGNCSPYTVGDGACTPGYESCGNSPDDCPCWDPNNPVCDTNQWPGVCVPGGGGGGGGTCYDTCQEEVCDTETVWVDDYCEVCDQDNCYWEVCGGHEETNQVNCHTNTFDCNPHPCEVLAAAVGGGASGNRAPSLTPLTDAIWSGAYTGVLTFTSVAAEPLVTSARSAGFERPLLLRLAPLTYTAGWSVRRPERAPAPRGPSPELRLVFEVKPEAWLSPLRTASLERKMPPKMANARRSGREQEVAS